MSPNLTPVYDLTDLDFVDEKGNKDPVQAQRVDPFQPADHPARRMSFARQSIRRDAGRGARSIADRALWRARRLDDRRRTRFATRFVVGPIVAQTILQRALYVRTQFHVQAVLGILPARSHGYRHDHRRQSRPVRLPRSHRRDRGGRQRPADRHRRGTCRRRFDAGAQSVDRRDVVPAQPSGATPARSTRR